MKQIFLVGAFLICFSLTLSSALAQQEPERPKPTNESCESLLAGFEATIANTHSMTRETKVKAGFFQIAFMKDIATQTDDGLVVEVLEHSGMLPDPETQEPETRFFQALDFNSNLCDDHRLEVIKENKYLLDITENDDETPQESYSFTFLGCCCMNRKLQTITVKFSL